MRKNEEEKERIDKRGGRASSGRRLLILLAAGTALALGAAWVGDWYFRAYVDGFSIRQPAGEAVLREVLWEPPAAFLGPCGDAVERYEPALSGDGSILVFTRGKAKENADLFEARWDGRTWSEPVPLERINSPADELGPELSRDGSVLLFYSDRPGGMGGYDLWRSRFDGDSWGAPENLGALINSTFNEYDPALFPGGGLLLFSSNRLDRDLTEEERCAWGATLREDFLSKDYDLFAAEWREGSNGFEGADAFDSSVRVRRLDVLCTPFQEGQADFSSRGDFLYFSSNRPGGKGGFDLYRSRLLGDDLLEPENLGVPVNSPWDDMDPSLSMEGFRLVFSTNRAEPGAGDARRFDLLQSYTREVYSQQDYSALLALLRKLERLKWPLSILLLALAALLLLLRFLKSGRYGLDPSLLKKCLVLSLLIHLLLALVTSTVIVSYGLVELAMEGSAEAFLHSEALAEESLGLQIREMTAELAGLEPAAAPAKRMEPPISIEAEPRSSPQETFESAPLSRESALAAPERREPVDLPEALAPARIEIGGIGPMPLTEPSKEREALDLSKRPEAARDQEEDVLATIEPPLKGRRSTAYERDVAPARPKPIDREREGLDDPIAVARVSPIEKIDHRKLTEPITPPLPRLSVQPPVDYEPLRSLPAHLEEAAPRPLAREKQLAESRPALEPSLPKGGRNKFDPAETDMPALKREHLPPLETALLRESALPDPGRSSLEDPVPLIKPFRHESLPTYFGLEVADRRIIFCLDVSSSMEWNHRLEDARAELLRLLDHLDERVEFNILLFSGQVRAWSRNGLEAAGAENVRSAKRFVRSAGPEPDGTNTMDALSAALSEEDVECIYLLSDGHPTVGSTLDTAAILAHVQELQRARGVKIHTIAYLKGEPPREWRNRVPKKERLLELMDRLASQNSGHCVVFE